MSTKILEHKRLKTWPWRKPKFIEWGAVLHLKIWGIILYFIVALCFMIKLYCFFIMSLIRLMQVSNFKISMFTLQFLSMSWCIIFHDEATSFLFSSLRIRRRSFFRIEKNIFIFYRLFIFILPSNVKILATLILKQGFQGLKAFAFCILNVNDEHTKQT